jgi:hypothetical protein
MAELRVSDEQLTEWAETYHSLDRMAIYGAVSALIADLRAAREESRQLRARIQATRDYVMRVDEENSQRSLTEQPKQISADRITDLLGDGMPKDGSRG